MNKYPYKKIQKNVSKILSIGVFMSFILILAGIAVLYLAPKIVFFKTAGIYVLLLTPVFRLFAVAFGYYKQKRIKYALLPLISAALLVVLFVMNYKNI